MVNLVVVSHGAYAQSMVDASCMLVGEHTGVRALSLAQGNSAEDLLEEVKALAADADSGRQVLFLCDVMAGTPFNVCSVASKGNPNVKVFYGVNLPLFLEAVTQKDTMDVDALADYLMECVSGVVGIGAW
jgi:mannose/fructose/sorbose-specific phosphotransferase system IIA component